MVPLKIKSVYMGLCTGVNKPNEIPVLGQKKPRKRQTKAM